MRQQAVGNELVTVFGGLSVDEFIREQVEELACATGETAQQWLEAHGGRWA